MVLGPVNLVFALWLNSVVQVEEQVHYRRLRTVLEVVGDD